ncbi:MAG TPA: hypothetical protein VJB57_21390 [Dehalococcoidia bacterium]|nr:hypothetical protein [Dehalococcoidia bacterium]
MNFSPPKDREQSPSASAHRRGCVSAGRSRHPREDDRLSGWFDAAAARGVVKADQIL